MNPTATLLARFRAWRDHRRALRAHEEWEKTMEQPRQERKSNSLPPPAYHDYLNRQCDSILKHLEAADESARRAMRSKQTEGDE